MAQQLQTVVEPKVPAIPTQVLPPRAAPPSHPLVQDLRKPVLLGGLILLVFFVIGGGWAAMAPVAGAVIAPGVVSPLGNRQRVQHLEGGIIREIRVQEGDHVNAGDVLITLTDVGSEAEAGQLTSRLQALAATEARLTAERDSAGSISFDHPSLAAHDDPKMQGLIEQQINQFVARRANDASQEAILKQRIEQLRQQIVGAQKQLESVRRQNDLIKEEVAVVRDMFNKGYEKKSRLLALLRAEADLEGQEGELMSQIARAEEQIGETNLQIVNIKVKRKEDTDQQLAETQARRVEVEQQIRDSLDRLKRTAVIAPVSGRVIDLHFKTSGGVIRPGEPILDLIPDDGDLTVDVRISPKDIDDVHTGQHAYVMFPSFPQRNLHRVDAEVEEVSADVFQDERTGQSYYTGIVYIDRDRMQALDPEITLTPGMPAEVYIPTIERTLLQYLVQPLLFTIEHSFREH